MQGDKSKLLYVSYPGIPFTLPNFTNRTGGGLEVLERFILSSLLEEYDITVLCPKDSSPSGYWEDKIIVGDYLSREECGKLPTKQMVDSLVLHQESFDKIFINNFELGNSPEKLLPFSHKLYLLNHTHISFSTSAFMVNQYHMSYILSSLGDAKLGFVQPNVLEELERKIEGIKKNPYLLPGYPVNLYERNFFNVNMKMTDECFYHGDVGLGDHWCMVSRCTHSKAVMVGINSWLKSGVGGSLKVFLKEGSTRKDSELLKEVLAISEKNPKVEIIFGAERGVIAESLCKARGMIFPSKVESMGLVALESVLCGSPVVYSHPCTHNFLEGIPHNSYVSTRRVSLYAKEIQKIDSSINIDVKREIRARALESFPREKCSESLLDFVRK